MTGYRKTIFNGRRVPVHHLVWFKHYGEWPSGELDHINRDRQDNRIENLRLASRMDNNCNRATFKNNRSGEKNVVWDRINCRWQVKIQRGCEKVYANCSSKISAILAARLIRRLLHGEFAYQPLAGKRYAHLVN